MPANLIELACLWEATVPKPGNVHPHAAFHDTCYDDFVRSARAIGPVFDQAHALTVGQLVFEAVQATRQAVGKNTNLGIILVLAPLVKTHDRPALEALLNNLTIHDTELVYQAIRLAQPGGLGQAKDQDVADHPTVTLLEAMRLAADRDLIARQYVTTFHDVFEVLLPTLKQALSQYPPEVAIQHTFLTCLATLGDTLIRRKCGSDISNEARRQARSVLDAGWPHTPAGQKNYDQLDSWLRADGHRRNPGTTADLVCGAIYLAFVQGILDPDLRL